MRAKTLLAAGAALALTAVLSAALRADADEEPAHTPPDATVEWQPCEADPTADCGVLDVPIDWSDPGGETVGLNLTRRPAENPDERLGSLVINTGGPGSPTALVVLHMIEGVFGEEIRDRFDLVGFDPRGVGYSDPISCSEDLLAAEPDSFLEGQGDFAGRVDFNRRLAADCSERNGELYDHVDTLSVVHDLDALRAALGDERLTYYGVSYGTAIGQQYAEEYPERVRALALDSNVDHSVDTVSWLRLKAEMFQGAFDSFADWCEADERCALHGGDVREVWGEVLDRADAGEYDHPEEPGERLDSYDVIDAAFECAHGTAWSELAGFVETLDSGASPEALPCSADTEPPVEIEDPQALHIVNFCSDYALPVADYAEWERLVNGIGEEYAPDVRYNPNAIDRIADCLGHGEPVNPQHELDVEGSAPILLANPLGDPITGHNMAVNAAAQIGEEARLLTYEGTGHGAYGFFSGSDCATEAIDAYLIDTELPEEGYTCPAVPYEP